jgi:hypothetical protein
MPESLKPPYIRKIDEHGNLQVWLVDGSYVRSHINVGFTNYGQHYSCSYIPSDELWIDSEAKGDEQRFYTDHLLTEHRLMAQGASYYEAAKKADSVERRERRRAGDMNVLTHNGQTLPDGRDVHERLWKKTENGVSIWIVNGRLVRSVFDIDFADGGHDHVYEYVPQNEVWIDDDLQEKERGYILLHELHERNVMAKGLPYEKAHNEANRLEYRCRHQPDKLHDALTAEGWAY